jgi:hypothetical protein
LRRTTQRFVPGVGKSAIVNGLPSGCQGEIDTHDKFCRHCGAAVRKLGETSTSESAPEAPVDISMENVAKDINDFLQRTYGHEVKQTELHDGEVTSETDSGEQPARINIPVESGLSELVQKTYGHHTLWDDEFKVLKARLSSQSDFQQHAISEDIDMAHFENPDFPQAKEEQEEFAPRSHKFGKIFIGGVITLAALWSLAWGLSLLVKNGSNLRNVIADSVAQPDLEVKAFPSQNIPWTTSGGYGVRPPHLVITNIGHGPIIIISVAINQRNDCAKDFEWQIGDYGHLEIGEHLSLNTTCNIVRATVKTNHGIGEYQ